VIRTWHWTDKIGWKRTSFARPESAAIPFGSGFGCRKDPDAWADEIKSALHSNGAPHLNWSALVDVLPALRYVLPDDLRMIVTTLRSRHNVRTVNDDEGFPIQIGTS